MIHMYCYDDHIVILQPFTRAAGEPRSHAANVVRVRPLATSLASLFSYGWHFGGRVRSRVWPHATTERTRTRTPSLSIYLCNGKPQPRYTSRGGVRQGSEYC